MSTADRRRADSAEMRPAGSKPPEALARVAPAQRALAVLAGLMCLPYMVLKIAWLSGSRIGLNDPEFGTSSAMYVLNLLTGLLDVVALGLAVVFFTRRGARAPAWLVLPPMWIGAGLLGQVLLALPYALVQQALTSPALGNAQAPPIAGWVFGMVYGGFAGMGIGLLGAFAIYAWRRWGRRPAPPLTALSRGALIAASALAAGAGLVHLAGSDHPLGNRLQDLTLALVAAGGLLILARPRVSAGAFRAAVVVAFVGTGALAAWGTYHGVITLVPNELVGSAEIDWRGLGASSLRMIAGFAGAGAMILRLQPRSTAVAAQ
ncbi:MAG TPA: hypothetical protein VK095_13175 [Beutenbergiaceae bacterium]|nr:hypothetical protein [Beutenbergiaceae bacterium]